MNKTELENAMNKMGIVTHYEKNIVNVGLADVELAKIDFDLFTSWFNSMLNFFLKANYKASWFVKAMKNEYNNGTFFKETQLTIVDSDTEDKVIVINTCKEWDEMILCLTGEHPDEYTSYIDRQGNVRGYSDGAGGFIYLDQPLTLKEFEKFVYEEKKTKPVDSINSLIERYQMLEKEETKTVTITPGLFIQIQVEKISNKNLANLLEKTDLEIIHEGVDVREQLLSQEQDT